MRTQNQEVGKELKRRQTLRQAFCMFSCVAIYASLAHSV
jgi:hypothetical protein